ncbi:MAG: hypothetical protein J6L72_05430, partial [Butyricicoccus sp.]|nr:hypothetical protein [Butyricicoccus sp.]
EDLLGDDNAADQPAEGVAGRGNDRDHRVAQRMYKVTLKRLTISLEISRRFACILRGSLVFCLSRKNFWI